MAAYSIKVAWRGWGLLTGTSTYMSPRQGFCERQAPGQGGDRPWKQDVPAGQTRITLGSHTDSVSRIKATVQAPEPLCPHWLQALSPLIATSG